MLAQLKLMGSEDHHRAPGLGIARPSPSAGELDAHVVLVVKAIGSLEQTKYCSTKDREERSTWSVSVESNCSP